MHGYHPFAEDGGLYLTGVKRVLEPGMYPHETGFVLGHLRFSAFAPAIATTIHLSGMGLPTSLLLVYLTSIWATLWAGWLLAKRCFLGRARIGAVCLLATWLTLPVAGTSLMVMDPYVTARSISTPCILLALAFVFDFLKYWKQHNEYDGRALFKIGATLTLAALMHPLMAAYGFACVLALSVSIARRRRTWLIATAALCVAAVGVAALLQMVGQPEGAGYRQVAMSRYYWFLSQWHWYEWLGLIGPIAILGYAGFVRQGTKPGDATVAMARMCITVGAAAVLVALIFARPDAEVLLVARLQPLRVFQTIYIVMILFLGAGLSVKLGNRKILWGGTFTVLAAIMFLAQREIFPDSAHIELPKQPQVNAWVQAFDWIRSNTPKDAFFALDADYISKPGEDAQSFRAIAERSALPDYSKDGGEAAITPSLTDEWTKGQRLQTRLSALSDAERVAALRPAGVNWVVLEQSARTAFPCEYANETVKVCRLPRDGYEDNERVSLQTKTSSPPEKRQ